MSTAHPPTEATTVDRLLDATLESIHQHGFGATTVTTVTEIAGLSRGMVRHEFGSKQRMVVAALSHLCERWLRTTEPIDSLTGAAQVRSIVRAMFAPETFTPKDVDAWIALSVQARSDADLREIRERTQARWLEQITAAYRAAGVEGPEVAARATLATADGLWLQYRIGGQALDHAEATATALRVADAMLGDAT